MSALRSYSAANAGPRRDFTLRHSANGNWIVEGPDKRCGGIFIDERAARDFIDDEERATRTGPLDREAPSLLPLKARPLSRRSL